MSQPHKPTTIQLESVLSAATIPALPESAISVLEASRSPDVEYAKLAEPIEADSALAVQVLRFINSSYFGFRQEISSIRQGVSLVGVRTIKNFVLWTALFSAVPDPKARGFSLKGFRQDSLRRGFFSRRLARSLDARDIDEVFTGAMLQDIAVPLLVREIGDPYLEMIGHSKDASVTLSQLEQRSFGWSHAEVGAALLRRWHLPDSLADLVATHCDLSQLIDGENPSADALAVSFSALLPNVSEERWTNREHFESCWNRLSAADSEPLPEFLGHVDEDFANFSLDRSQAATTRSLLEQFDSADPAERSFDEIGSPS